MKITEKLLKDTNAGMTLTWFMQDHKLIGKTFEEALEIIQANKKARWGKRFINQLLEDTLKGKAKRKYTLRHRKLVIELLEYGIGLLNEQSEEAADGN